MLQVIAGANKKAEAPNTGKLTAGLGRTGFWPRHGATGGHIAAGPRSRIDDAGVQCELNVRSYGVRPF